jgi:hypothetical protein
VVILLLGAASTWATREHIARSAAAQHERSLAVAPGLYREVLEQQRAALTAMGGALAGDTRIRSTLGVAATDEATVRDILEDLRGATSADVLAVIDGDGVVRAVVGAPRMLGVDLGSSALLQPTKPDGHRAFALWSVDKGVALIVAVPVLQGRDVGGFMLVGRRPSDSALDAVAQSLGLHATLQADGNTIHTTTPPPDPRAPAAYVRRDELASTPSPVAVIWSVVDEPATGPLALVASAAPVVIALVAVALLFAVRRTLQARA